MAASDDIERLQAHPWMGQVHYQDEVDSTNDWARRFLHNTRPNSRSDLDRPQLCPQLFLTDNQTAGRGQREHRWWSGPGSLTTTVAVPLSAPPHTALPLASGLAVTLAIRKWFPELTPLLKWPNDVYLDGKKLAGVLCETVPVASTHWVLIGIGCNVNTSIAAAPTSLRGSLTSLADQGGHPINLIDFLLGLLDALRQALEQLDRAPAELIAECQTRLVWSVGQELRIECAGRKPLIGQFLGLSDQGELRIDVAGIERVIGSARQIRLNG